MLYAYVKENSLKEDYDNAEKLREIEECSFRDRSRYETDKTKKLYEDWQNGYKIIIDEINNTVNIITPEGETIPQKTKEEAEQTCNLLAKQKQLTPEQIDEYKNIYQQSRGDSKSLIQNFQSQHINEIKNWDKSFIKEAEDRKMEFRIESIVSIVSDYKKIDNNPPYDISKSEVITNTFDNLLQKRKDEKGFIPKLTFGSGIKIDNRKKSVWVRENVPDFFRGYDSAKAENMLKYFGRQQMNAEQYVNNFIKFNGLEPEDVSVLGEDFFGVKIKINSTGEEFFHNYPLPKFLNNWSANRIFNMGLNSHDALGIFFDENVLKQPLLSNFLLNEFSTSTEELDILLRKRQQGIESFQSGETGIEPGGTKKKERKEIIIYPDSKAGINEYWADKKFSGYTGKMQTELVQQFATNLSNSGYSDNDIDKFFQNIFISETQEIGPIVKDIGVFQFKILEKTDPLGSVLGNLTGCCQKLNGVGETCMYDGFSNPFAGFLVVFNEGKVVGQSWIRLGTPTGNNMGTLYLDNIETARGWEKNQSLKRAYVDFAKFLKEERKYENIISGERYSEITFPDLPLKRMKPKKQEFPDTKYNVYTDLGESNRVLAQKKWY